MDATEIKKDGFDLVMVPEGREFQCAIYRTGKQVPLRRKLIASRAKAVAWFESFVINQGS